MPLLTSEQIDALESMDDAARPGWATLLSHARAANERIAELEKRIVTLQRELAFETGASDSL